MIDPPIPPDEISPNGQTSRTCPTDPTLLLHDDRDAWVLYTIGYGNRSADDFDALVPPEGWLIDVRLNPYGRPEFTRPALMARFGTRYWHLPSLGNSAYKDPEGQTVLADPDRGITLLEDRFLLSSVNTIFCACLDYRVCHRLLVARLFKDYMAAMDQPITIVHL